MDTIHYCYNNHPHLGDGHHQPVLLLEVGEHLQEVEIGPALEEDDGGDDGDQVQDQEQEEVRHRGLRALGCLVCALITTVIAEQLSWWWPGTW